MYDVIVVGSGPAGATAARLTAHAGLSTLLIEKAKLPRVKTCAGGVSLHTLKNLGIDVPDSVVERKCNGARVKYGDFSLESEVDEWLAYMVSRDVFDNYLTRCAVDAGAKLMEGVRARSVDVREDHVEVETTQGTFSAGAVIGADGVHSVCAKKVRPAFDPKHVGFLLEAEIPAEKEYIDKHIGNKGEFHFGVVENGYGWIFPKSEHLSVGIGGIGTDVTDPREAYSNFIKSLGLEHVKPRGHFIPEGGVRRRTYSDRILLAGDAAGYVDAFLGEGIAYAVESGKLAAETVIEAHRKGDLSETFLSSYQKRCEDKFGVNLKYSMIFSRTFHRYPDFFAKVLATNRSLIHKFLYLSTGNFGYLPFIKWIIPRLPYFALRSLFAKP